MGTVIVDAATGAKLLAAGREVEVRDESGRLLGKFVQTAAEWPPAPPPGYEMYGEPWPSDEEIERRLREGKRYTIEQVLEHLRGLDDAR